MFSRIVTLLSRAYKTIQKRSNMKSNARYAYQRVIPGAVHADEVHARPFLQGALA